MKTGRPSARSWRRWAPWLLAVAAALLVVPPATACSCKAHPPTLVAPRDGTPAPVNAAVQVSVLAGQLDQPGTRLALEDLDGRPVPSRQRRIDQEDVAIVVLTPEAPLAPKRRFRTVLHRRAFPTKVVFGTFTTTAKRDRQAPELARVSKVEVFRRKVAMCASGATEVRLVVPEATDAGRKATLRYGVWLEPKGEMGPPDGYLTYRDGGLSLGLVQWCAFDEIPLPADRGLLRVAVAAIDEAGNHSEVRHATANLSRVEVR